ncbi:hypothetical protein Agub_g13221 [Astrephomene gubernaculifera]|uniref:Guanylate cyclase domain-containing protein n=1 Tax=Astrephomene gubernaculifera TaxID=47775 RepID=A0AAD3E2C4_9CHLO|nr:hypothetical protein Agub_g13221 [Astrephomene gubernaculifera]
MDPGPSVAAYYPQAANAAALPPAVPSAKLEEAFAELTVICPALGELAKSCVLQGGEEQLTFSDVVRELEERVMPALAVTMRQSCRRAHSGAQTALPAVSGLLMARATASERPEQQSTFRRLLAAASSVRLGRSQHQHHLQQMVVMEEGGSGGSNTGGGGQRLQGGWRRGSSGEARGNRRSLQLTPAVEGGPRRKPGRSNHVTREDLLFDIFPPKVASALQAGEAVQPERYDCVSIFFSDVVGYTDLCSKLQPNEVMDLMHRLYSLFDDLIRDLELFKVETVGDAYLAVGNLCYPQPDCHARLMTQFAFAAMAAATSLPIHPGNPELGCVHIRVGLHCGPVVGSVVGTLNRRYCLFGDAVNTAARMEHNSEADRVHCSAAFAALLQEQWPEGAQVTSRGVRQIKGKGPMETFWVEERPLHRSGTGLGNDDCGGIVSGAAGDAAVTIEGDIGLTFGTCAQHGAFEEELFKTLME